MNAEWQLVCLTHNLLKLWRAALTKTPCNHRPSWPKSQSELAEIRYEAG
jgi:hypothetical protein